MTDLIRVCDGVFRNPGAVGDEEIHVSGVKLRRFMDFFYLRCFPDELTPIEVSELCRERAKHPETISSVNESVRQIFRDLIEALKPQRLLEIGAGSRPIFSLQESEARGVSYTTADADPDIEGCVFSGMSSGLDFPDGHFEMAAAVFVLHFHFYDAQIAELCRCLSPGGVFLANVYYRTEESRGQLRNAFDRKGLQLLVVDDPLDLCKSHEFWLAGKSAESLELAGRMLEKILKNSIAASAS